MGRYFDGDISGKFAFGCQSSCIGEEFGAIEQEPASIDYVVLRENLDVSMAKMAELEEKMGDQKQKIDEFFEKNNGYHDAALIDAGIDPSHLPPYFDWYFGKKIIDFFEQNPKANECYFTAEL